jgi:hypothetical protein
MGNFLSGPLVLVIALLAEAATGLRASPPPPAPAKAPTDQRPTNIVLKHRQDVRWELDRNFAHGIRTKSDDGKHMFQAVRAVDVSELDQKQRRGAELAPVDVKKPKSPFAVWSKHFDDPDLKFTNGYSSVVNEDVFTDLRMVRGKDAGALDPDGIAVGRVKLKDYDPVEVVQFLVASGIVDANIHVRASISGSHFTSEAGEWFSLHSDDPYWTNRENHERYDFGVHIATNGTIRLINRRYVGRPVELADKKPEVDTKP